MRGPREGGARSAIDARVAGGVEKARGRDAARARGRISRATDSRGHNDERRQLSRRAPSTTGPRAGRGGEFEQTHVGLDLRLGIGVQPQLALLLDASPAHGGTTATREGESMSEKAFRTTKESATNAKREMRGENARRDAPEAPKATRARDIA